MADTADSSFPVSPRATTRLSRQAHATAVRLSLSGVDADTGAGVVESSISSWYKESVGEKLKINFCDKYMMI